MTAAASLSATCYDL